MRNVSELKIERVINERIATSGYTDRYMMGDVKIRIKNPRGNYCLFESMEDASAYLEDSGYFESQMGAIKFLRAIKPLRSLRYKIWDGVGIESGYLHDADEIASVDKIMQILSGFVKIELRLEWAKTVKLTPKIHAAVCFGNHHCNQNNSELAHVRNGYKIYIKHPQFELYSKFDENAIRDALIEIAENPEKYHFGA